MKPSREQFDRLVATLGVNPKSIEATVTLTPAGVVTIAETRRATADEVDDLTRAIEQLDAEPSPATMPTPSGRRHCLPHGE